MIIPFKRAPIGTLWTALLLLPALVLTLASCTGGRTVCTAMAARILGPALTVDDGVVYGNRGKVFALRASDGTVLWQTAEVRVYKAVPPVVDGHSVIVSAGVGVIAALRASDGASLWRTTTLSGVGVASSLTPDPVAVVADGAVYAAVNYGTLAAWDERDGHSLWVSDFAPGAGAGEVSGGENPPLPVPVAAGAMICVSAGRSVYALRAVDGSLLWQLPAALGASYGTPVVSENTVYVADSNGTVLALDATTGVARWRAQGSTSAVARPPLSVIVRGQTVFAVSGGDTVRALSAATGAVLWRFVTGEAVPEFVGRLSPPVLSGGRIYVASIASLYVADAATGRQVWRAPLNPVVAMGVGPTGDAPIPAIGQGAVFVVTGHGAEAWRAADGSVMWSMQTARQGDQSAFAAGTVYLTQWGLTAPCGGDPLLPHVFALRGADGAQLWQVSI